MNIEKLRVLLKEGQVLINFTKKDGSDRVMRATTNLDMINYEFKNVVKEDKDEKVKNTNLIHVWDLDIAAWRSIRIPSIQGWTIPR